MFERGRVVKSIAGRDSNSLLVVLKAEEKEVFVSDGRERPIDRPKRKNIRHVCKLDLTLDEADMRSNKSLKKAIKKAEIICNKQEG